MRDIYPFFLFLLHTFYLHNTKKNFFLPKKNGPKKKCQCLYIASLSLVQYPHQYPYTDSMLSTFQKDWSTPRTAQCFTGTPVVSDNPAGTILHVVNNSRIPCNMEEFLKYGKAHISFTVVGIKKIGFSYAPWKKNPKGGNGKRESTKKLIDDPQMFEHGQERILRGVHVYSFPREGKSDKGPRNDESKALLEVGMTFHMAPLAHMYENKNKGENVFPDSPSVFEPYQLLEMVVSAATDEQAEKGYGMQISSIRGLPFSLYSCYTSAWRELLLSTPSTIYEKVRTYTWDPSAKSFNFSSILESTNVGFLAHVKTDSYITTGPEEGWWSLVSDTNEVAPEIQKIDMEHGDVMGMTNAGENKYYMMFLMTLAAAADCLDFWVYRNEYNVNKNPSMSPFRGIPIIDTNKLLAFIKTDSLEECTYKIPFSIPGLPDAQVTIDTAPGQFGSPESDPEETCTDLVLRSDSLFTERGYHLTFGCPQRANVMKMVFKSVSSGAGVKRLHSRVDWTTFAQD